MAIRSLVNLKWNERVSHPDGDFDRLREWHFIAIWWYAGGKWWWMLPYRARYDGYRYWAMHLGPLHFKCGEDYQWEEGTDE